MATIQECTTICPNRHNHISGFPGYGRELCPFCKCYVKPVWRIAEENASKRVKVGVRA